MTSRESIRENWKELIRMTDVDGMIDHMYSECVLNENTMDEIERETDPRKKAIKLLKIVQQHPDKTAFTIFLEGLRETGNEYLANLMTDESQGSRRDRRRSEPSHREEPDGRDLSPSTRLRSLSLDTSTPNEPKTKTTTKVNAKTKAKGIGEPRKDSTVVLGPDLGSAIRLSTLRGCAYNAKKDKLYLASVGSGRILVCNSKGQNPGVFYNVPSPCDVAVREDGDRVYVIAIPDVYSTHLHILTSGRLTKTIDSVPAGKLGACEAVACHKQNIAVLSNKHGVVLFTHEGKYVGQWKLRDIVGRGMTIDHLGSVYITDSKTGSVTVFSLKEKFGEVRKSPWITLREKLLPGTVANIWSPGICVDNDGNVYVSRFEANRIDVYDRDRRMLASFGEKGRGTGQFDGPYGLCLIAGERLVVTDSDNNRIQIFKVFD